MSRQPMAGAVTARGAAFATTAGNRRAVPYLTVMAQRGAKLVGTIAVVLPLFAILVASVWFAAGAWTKVSGPPMPAAGYIAMTLGIVFSLLIGCGLMALLFYSSRHGYDDPSQREGDDS